VTSLADDVACLLLTSLILSFFAELN